MRFLVPLPVVLVFLLLLLSLGGSCASSGSCDEALGISETSLNPEGSKCTRSCECNNQQYAGACVEGSCRSFKRSACDAPGTEQNCRIPQALVKDGCADGLQTCQPQGLKTKFWSRCKPNCQACESGKAEGCFTGPEKALGVGECKAGSRLCQGDKTWGACRGQVLPAVEICDGKDNDCNGIVDDNCVGGSETPSEQPPSEGSPESLDAGGERGPESAPEASQESHPDNVGKEDTPDAPAGPPRVSTFAGTAGTAGQSNGDKDTQAQFNTPWAVAFDKAGNMYIADQENYLIRRIDGQTGEVSTYAGNAIGRQGKENGPAQDAQFLNPMDLAFDSKGNLYVMEKSTLIRKLSSVQNGSCGDNTRYTGVCVTTYAGSGLKGYEDGPAKDAKFGDLRGLAIDSKDNLYVAEDLNHRLRKITFVRNGTCGGKAGYTGVCVSTYAGSGTAGKQNGAPSTAQFNSPAGLAFDSNDNLYIADYGNHLIRKIDAAGTTVSTFAGAGYGTQDGPASQALFNGPIRIVFDVKNELYISEHQRNLPESHRIRKVITVSNASCGGQTNHTGGCVITVAGDSVKGRRDGTAPQALFNLPAGLAMHAGFLYIADSGNHTIRKIAWGP